MGAVHRNESTPTFWHRYTAEQIEKVFDVCAELRDFYGIFAIVGHEEIDRKRKVDPGPAFPLEKLRDRVIVRDRKPKRLPVMLTREEVAAILMRRAGPLPAPEQRDKA